MRNWLGCNKFVRDGEGRVGWLQGAWGAGGNDGEKGGLELFGEPT